jgi:hypothetical protein
MKRKLSFHSSFIFSLPLSPLFLEMHFGNVWLEEHDKRTVNRLSTKWERSVNIKMFIYVLDNEPVDSIIVKTTAFPIQMLPFLRAKFSKFLVLSLLLPIELVIGCFSTRKLPYLCVIRCQHKSLFEKL